MTSIKHMYCSNEMPLRTATYSLYMPACKQSFEPALCQVLCTLQYFFLTRLLLPNGSISTFPPLQRTSTRQLKHFYKHPVDEFLRRRTLRDGAINEVISKVNPQQRYRHVFNSATTTTTYEQPGRPGLISFLFIKIKHSLVLSYLSVLLRYFSAAVQPWGGGLVSEKKAEEKMVKSVRGRGRMKEGRPAEITTGSIFLPLAL